MSQETNDFIAKVDAFAQELDPQEQAMLRGLLSHSGESDSDDDVAGFGRSDVWPGLRVVSGPIPIAKLESQFDTFLSSGHTGNVINPEASKGKI